MSIQSQDRFTLTSSVGTVVENEIVLGPAVPLKYKLCLVVPHNATEKALVNGYTLSGATIRKSNRFRLSYVVNHQIFNLNFLKIQVGVQSDNPEVSIVYRVGNEWSLSKTRITDWSAPIDLENYKVMGYRVASVPEGTYVGSPVLDSLSGELIGIIISPSKGEVLPASQLISDISQVLSDIESKTSFQRPVVQDGILSTPLSTWRLARDEEQAHSGLSLRIFQEVRRNFGLKIENITTFTSQGTTLFVLTSSGRTIAFDTKSEQRLWDFGETQTLLPLVLIALNEENLLLLQGSITLDTIADFWGDRNQIRDNIGLIHLINVKTGERKQVTRYGFPGAVQILRGVTLIGGLGYYFFMDVKNKQQMILRVPERRIDVLRWCMPVDVDAKLICGVEIPCRLAGRGERQSPYALRAEGHVEIVEREWTTGKVISRHAVDKTIPAQRPLSSSVVRVNDSEIIISTNTKLYYCTINRARKKSEIIFHDNKSISIVNEGYVVSNDTQILHISADLRKVHWRFVSESEISQVLVNEKYIFFTTLDGRLFNLNLSNGKTNWVMPISFAIKHSPIPVGHDLWLISEDYQLIKVRDCLRTSV